MQVNHTIVDHIPLIWIEPEGAVRRNLAIWLPGFSGTKEGVEQQLRDLAAAGFVALSYDPWQHGERRVETQEALGARVVSNIRRHFWPILAHTAEEVLRVIDWAEAELGVEPGVRMGGISMGGDIAVAAAGLDRRIQSVAACVATPDWLRPGSFEPPGTPDAYAQLGYDRRNPLTNLGSYAHGPAISFQCGANDTQVPPDGAERFIEALRETHPIYRDAPQRLAVDLHPDTGHAFTPAMWQNCLSWFNWR